VRENRVQIFHNYMCGRHILIQEAAIYDQWTWDFNLHVWQLYFNLGVMVIPLKNFNVACANLNHQHTANKDYKNVIHDIIWLRVVRPPQNLYEQICPMYP
jgi:hypothetical protein